MLRVECALPQAAPEAAAAAIREAAGCEGAAVFTPKRRAVDARHGRPRYAWTFEVRFGTQAEEREFLERCPPEVRAVPAEEAAPYRFPPLRFVPERRPVVAGFGPAGMFCALLLARAGARPIVLERGAPMEERVRRVEEFFRGGPLDAQANVQFGEGGAGTFSDGKLNTLVKDRSFRGYFVLEEFVRAGAPREILYLARPHIGTDLLRGVIVNLRKEIERCGGEIRFHTALTGLGLDGGRLCALTAEGPGGAEEIRADALFLALGHSARDSFRMLYTAGVPVERKPFSVGVRIEHPRAQIDEALYGRADTGFPPAEYKLVAHGAAGRSVYTFCMCPGGRVVAAASASGGVVTNGMSDHARNLENSNSALLCEVLPEDGLPGGALGGIEFQIALEHAAFRMGGGDYRAPAQTVGDFLAGRPTERFGVVRPSYPRGVRGCDLNDLLPPGISAALRAALPVFARKLRGFDRPDAVLTAVESRSSAPVRILRGEDRQSPVGGLYPAGEGAGYAGGIVSAAIDGIRAAEAYAAREAP